MWFPTNGYYNDGIADIGFEELETDPYVCACAVTVEFINKVPITKLNWCSWVNEAEHEIHNLTQNARALPENVAAIALVKSHKRMALGLQGSRYKGDKHEKAVERAKKERDAL